MKTFNCIFVIFAGILAVSCKDSEVISDNSSDVSDSYQNFMLRATDSEVSIKMEGKEEYDVIISQSDTGWLSAEESDTRSMKEDHKFTFLLSPNESGSNREAKILLKKKDTGELIKTLTVTQSASSLLPGDLLIEEIFYTSSKLLATGRPSKRHDDQYIKITNNTNGTLDISGLMIMESMITSSMADHYFDSLTVLPNYAPVQTVYCIPDTIGSILSAGESIIIANNAGNHTTWNPNSFDLSGAAFEWYNSMLDIDNPTVPNLDVWLAYVQSDWVLHDRGFQGYAIAMPPVGMTKAQFLADYKWEGKYKFYNAGNATWYTMNISNAYKVPNAWVIDAVNLGVPSVWKHNSFNPSLDAGYTYCGTINSDPNRYGKSVIRKKNLTSGKLIDTNNSSNDFTPNATPSLAI